MNIELELFAQRALDISDTLNRNPAFAFRNQDNKDLFITGHAKLNAPANKRVWIQYQRKRRSEVYDNINNTMRGPFLFMVQVNRQENRFIKHLIRVNDIFEYTAKHFMLRDNRFPIFAAGEIMIDGNDVSFNLLSGTYQLQISQGLRQFYTENQITNLYQRALSIIFNRPMNYTNRDIVTPVLRRVRLSNLNQAGIKYQDVPFSSTKWLKQTVMSSPQWPNGMSIKRKVGKSSMYGVVFRLSNPRYLVKITLIPLRQNGMLNTNIVDREFRILEKTGMAEKKFSMTANMTDEARRHLPAIFRGEIGNRVGLYVIIMKDFFYGSHIEESGDLVDFFQRHRDDYKLKKDMLKEFRAAARELRAEGITHGDLHFGNVLYKIIDGKIFLQIIDYGMSYIGPNKSGLPNRVNVQRNLYGRQHIRPIYRNNRGASVIVPDSFYTGSYIKGMFSNNELLRYNYNKYKNSKKTNNQDYERMKLVEATLSNNPNVNVNRLLRNTQLNNTKKQILRNIIKNELDVNFIKLVKNIHIRRV